MILIFLIFVIFHGDCFSLSKDNSESNRGILDGLTQAPTSTTTSKPNVLNALSSGLNVVSNSGPMLILGGFQAIVTKFDPSLIQGLPGLPQIPNPAPGTG